jgi:hypothetical protein
MQKNGNSRFHVDPSMIPKNDGRFSEKIILEQEVERDDDSTRSRRALGCPARRLGLPGKKACRPKRLRPP